MLEKQRAATPDSSRCLLALRNIGITMLAIHATDRCHIRASSFGRGIVVLETGCRSLSVRYRIGTRDTQVLMLLHLLGTVFNQSEQDIPTVCMKYHCVGAVRIRPPFFFEFLDRCRLLEEVRKFEADFEDDKRAKETASSAS